MASRPVLIARKALRQAGLALLGAIASAALAQGARVVDTPTWIYPVPPPSPSAADAAVVDEAQSVPGSAERFTKAQLRDLFAVADWRPKEHPAMPAVVASGRKPAVFACGYCHLPTGTGRPENANLTGLSVAYILRQLADYRAGLRRSSATGMLPQALMAKLAGQASDDEMRAAADYFASLPVRSLVTVVETSTVANSEARGWTLVPVQGGGSEPIGRRIVELPTDAALTELRDPASGSTAYVPIGSVNAGRALASSVERGPACASCHGAELRGNDTAPPLAGRSPTYLARQLVDFQSGARAGTLSAPMREMATKLTLDDIVDLVAYASSLKP